MSFSPVNIEIVATAGAAVAKFKEVSHELGVIDARALKAGGSISRIDHASRLASAGLMAMSVAAVGVGYISVKAAMDAETAFARLNTAMTNAGAGSEANLESVKRLAEGNTRLGFDTIETANAYGTLITATGSQQSANELLNSRPTIHRPDAMTATT